MALTAITADYQIDISQGQDTSFYTTPNEIKVWSLDGLVLDKYPTALSLAGNILTQTLFDGSLLTADLSSLSTGLDKFPTGLSFNNGTDVLTLTLDDGSTLTAVITSTDTSVTGLAFNTSTNIMTLSESSGSTFTADLSSLSATAADNSIISSVYDPLTTSLTQSKPDLTSVVTDLSALGKWYSIGSTGDLVGTFDETYNSLGNVAIPSNRGNVMITLDLSTGARPLSIVLPAIASTPMGWECNILTYDTNVGGTINLTTDTPGSMFTYISDPLSALTVVSPYTGLGSTITLEAGHFYRIKKVNSEFFLAHYA